MENFNSLKEGLYQDFEESILHESKEHTSPQKPTPLQSAVKQKEPEFYEEDDED